MLDTKMINTTVSLDPPSNPDVGDLHIEQEDGVWAMSVWDGEKWVEVVIGDPPSGSIVDDCVEQDTPEKAYDRAMGIVR
jgi:hypothetical protein